MGTTKTEHFTEKQSEIAVIAKAMGHPARVALFFRKMFCFRCSHIFIIILQYYNKDMGTTKTEHFTEKQSDPCRMPHCFCDYRNFALFFRKMFCFRCSHIFIIILQYYDILLS